MADKHTKLSDIDTDKITVEEAQELFASQFDEPIEKILGTLRLVGYTDEDFQTLLEGMKDLMEATITLPTGMTVEESMPFVYVSDLLTLGALSYEVFLRSAEIAKVMPNFQ